MDYIVKQLSEVIMDIAMLCVKARDATGATIFKM